MKLIGNGTVVTRDHSNTCIENGAVVIKDQLIYEVGTLPDMKNKYPEAEYIDAHGGLIMPGFINTHSHIYSAFARGLSIKNNHPTNFLEILEGTWWKIDRKLSLDQIRYSAMVTYLESIQHGVTTVFDHHASYGAITDSLFTIAEVAKDMGIRTSLCYEISDRDGIAKMKESVDENIEFAKNIDEDQTDMIKSLIGMHASFTLSDETIDYCLSRNNSGVGYHIHVAEGIEDTNQCREMYQMSVVERLYRKGILGEKSVAGHCVHVSKEDYEILRETKTAVIHNPESNMGNAVGCPDVLGMMKEGILVGLGTDGYTNDMLESAKVANVLLKHEAKNPSVAWEEVPTMLYKNNARIAGRYFNHPVGILQKGAYADVIIMDYSPYTPLNNQNINSHLLFGASGRDVITTIINGKVRMKDRRMIDLDAEAIRKISKEKAERLWKVLGSS